MKDLKKQIEKILESMGYEKNKGGMFCIEIEPEDTIEISTIQEIGQSRNAMDEFDELVNEIELEEKTLFQQSVFMKLDIEDFEIEFGEFLTAFNEMVWIDVDVDKYYKQELKCNILLNVEDGNFDFDINTNNAMEDCDYVNMEKSSSIAWLLKQQGRTLRDMVKYYQSETSGDDFLDSVIAEVKECYSLGVLTFLSTLTVKQYLSIMEKLVQIHGNAHRIYLHDRKDCGVFGIPKETVCGLFDPWSGAGSLFGIEMDKSLIIPINIVYDIQIEGGVRRLNGGNSVDDVYGLPESLWDDGRIFNLKTK